MAADTQGNDLTAVGVPIGGIVAVAPYDEANVVADASMGVTPLTLPTAYSLLGLVKQDGAPSHGRESEDGTEFWQSGYLLPGTGTRTLQANFAELTATVLQLVEGKEANEHGVIYVDSNLPAAKVMLFQVTQFKNGVEKRHNGVAQVTAVEEDQDERGAVRGYAVTFTWQEDPLFSGSPFKMWVGTPVAAGGGSGV